MRGVVHLHLTDAWFPTPDRFPLWAGLWTGLNECPPHDHDYLEIALIISGKVRHLWAGGEEKVGPGSLVVVRPGAWHAYDPSPTSVYNLCIAESLLKVDLACLLQDNVLRYVLHDGPLACGRGGVFTTHLGEDAVTACQPRFADLNARLQFKDDSTRLEKVSAAADAMARLAAAVRAADGGASVPTSSPARHEAVCKVMTILGSDLTRRWTLAVLADRVCLTPSYLVRLFHTQVGMPPLAYQAQLRIQRAADLVLHSDEPIHRIGMMVGWDEPSYFARRFREAFGVSPRDYRAAMKPNADPTVM